MPQAKPRSSLLQFALIFAMVYLGSQVILRMFFPQQFGDQSLQGAIQVSAAKISAGNPPTFTIQNHTATGFVLVNRCPLPPVDVSFLENGKAVPLTASGRTVADCVVTPPVPAGGTAQISLSPWKYSLFARTGDYQLRLLTTPAFAAQQKQVASGATVGKSTLTATLTIAEPGLFTKLFRTFITKPFLNFLIFVASLLPDHNLGIAIIILTIVVKLILFFPTQHALEGQKKMQLIQPKLEALKKQYPGNPQKVQEETMKLWKEYKINPLQSCLPTLIQFPVLIGLFYTVRDGSVLALSNHLIYPFYQHLSWSFNIHFLGLDLLKPNLYVLPALLVILQFLQMRLAFAINERKKARQSTVIDVKKDKAKEPKSSSQIQQQVLTYILPFMIGFFALKFPSAVSIYWGVSTLFGIGQQIIVNREHLRV